MPQGMGVQVPPRALSNAILKSLRRICREPLNESAFRARGASVQIVNLHQSDPGGIVLSAQDGCVIAGRDRQYDARLALVRRRRHAESADSCFLRLAGLAVDLPVIIRRDGCAVAVVQLQSRNGKGTANR